jgi:hypothetical protein
MRLSSLIAHALCTISARLSEHNSSALHVELERRAADCAPTAVSAAAACCPRCAAAAAAVAAACKFRCTGHFAQPLSAQLLRAASSHASAAATDAQGTGCHDSGLLHHPAGLQRSALRW